MEVSTVALSQVRRHITVSTAEILAARFGPLMTLANLSETLARSREGLRISLRTECEFSRRVNATRVRLGRRVYFSTVKIAEIIGIND